MWSRTWQMSLPKLTRGTGVLTLRTGRKTKAMTVLTVAATIVHSVAVVVPKKKTLLEPVPTILGTTRIDKTTLMEPVPTILGTTRIDKGGRLLLQCCASSLRAWSGARASSVADPTAGRMSLTMKTRANLTLSSLGMMMIAHQEVEVAVEEMEAAVKVVRRVAARTVVRLRRVAARTVVRLRIVAARTVVRLKIVAARTVVRMRRKMRSPQLKLLKRLLQKKHQ